MDFRAYRKQRGLSQAEMARLLGIHRVTLSDYERGRAAPDPARVQSYRKKLGLCLDVASSAQLRPKTVTRHFPDVYPAPAAACCSAAWERLPTSYPDFMKRLGPLERELKAWIRVDSVLECLAWLQLYRNGAVLCFESPIRKGYPGQPICDEDGLCPGLRPMPCLAQMTGPCPYLLWTQVSLRTAWRTYRVDALILVYHRGKTQWVILEIDGAGHRGDEDKSRDESFGIPVIRAKASDVFSLNFPRFLEEELLAKFHAEP